MIMSFELEPRSGSGQKRIQIRILSYLDLAKGGKSKLSCVRSAPPQEEQLALLDYEGARTQTVSGGARTRVSSSLYAKGGLWLKIPLVP